MKTAVLFVFKKIGINIDRFLLPVLFLILSLNLSGQNVYTSVLKKFASGIWYFDSRQTNTYDSNNYLISTLSESYDQFSQSWGFASKTEYTNNPDRTVAQMTVQSGIGEQMMVLRTTFTYTPAKKVESSTMEFDIGTGFQPGTRTTNTYDGNGNLTNTLNEEYLGEWKNTSQTIYTNNPDGTINYSIIQYYYGAWTNSRRQTFTYIDGKVETITEDGWINSDWASFGHETFTYGDPDNSLLTHLTKNYDNGSFKDQYRTSYSYNPDGTINIILKQQWDGISVWMNLSSTTFGYSESTAISELKRDENFTIYPNPVKNKLIIRSIKKANFIEIFDITGKTVYQLKEAIPGEFNINVSQLKNGIYTISLMGDDGKISNKKFLKN